MNRSDRKSRSNELPHVPAAEVGLADRSEEVEELTDQELRLRLYQAMVEVADNEPGIVYRLCRAIASVIYDFCVFYLPRRAGGTVQLIAAHDVNPTIGPKIADILRMNRVPDYDTIRHAIQTAESSVMTDIELDLSFDGESRAPTVLRHMVLVPVRSSRGRVYGVLAVGRHATKAPYDESDRALLEWIVSHVAMKLENARLYRALRRANDRLATTNAGLAEAVKMRDRFLATASHELKTPLTTMLMQLDLLERRLENEEALAPLQSLRRQAWHLGRLVDQLLDMSRLVEGRVRIERERTDLLEVSREVVARFEAVTEMVNRTIVLEGESVVGRWDSFMLDQILSNLLSNALKHAQRGPIEIEIASTATHATLAVSDRGTGIASHDQLRIFRRFERGETEDTEGMGLGLWIVRRAVDQLEGEIEVESPPGRGATFRIRLPRQPSTS